MTKREEFYECEYVSGRGDFQFHVRAWSAVEAEQALRDSLASAGVRAAGTVVIRNLKGRILRRGRYSPPAQVEISA